MNLAEEVGVGLKSLGNSNIINEEYFLKLLESCLGVIIENEDTFRFLQLGNVKMDIMKGAYASLLTFLIMAARHDVDQEVVLSTLLQDYTFSQTRAEKLVKSYVENKSKLQAALSHVGSHPPHIVDASWTLDFCIKESSLDHIGTLQYLIQIHTETCDESSDVKKTTKKIKFVCTLEELQDLVGKLKDAVKHFERLAGL